MPLTLRVAPHCRYPRGGGKEQVMLWGAAMFQTARVQVHSYQIMLGVVVVILGVQVDSASEFMRIDAAMDMEKLGYDYSVAGNLRSLKQQDLADIHNRLELCHPYIMSVPRRLCFVSAHSSIFPANSYAPSAAHILHKHAECSGYDASANVIKSLMFEHARLRRASAAELAGMEERIYQRIMSSLHQT